MQFFGKTAVPRKIQLESKILDKSIYGPKRDELIEFYFFAERITSKTDLHLALDIHLVVNALNYV